MASATALIDSYGLSKSRGFLPQQSPSESFQDSYYAPWDSLITNLPQLISSHTLSQEIAALPLLSTAKLVSESEYQRAYAVLSFLVHAIIWGSREDGKATERIPPQITDPYLEVCERLGMQQVLSYAGLCLWNWSPRQGEQPNEDGFYELTQLRSIASFMESRGEDTFYHVPVLIEAEGGPLVYELLKATDNAAKENVAAVTEAFRRTAKVFEKMIKHLPKLYASLDADMFYHQLRPYLAGGKGMEDKGLHRGFVFQRSDASEMQTQHIGGSAAQSSLFPFLDMVLGVEHQQKAGSESIFQEMRRYMPRSHRNFLDAVSQYPSLRSFVQAHSGDEELCQAFNSALKQLRIWRSTHIAVVSKYVVRPARQAAAAEIQSNGDGADPGATEFEAANGEELQGTGGSALIPFLKQSRDETTALA